MELHEKLQELRKERGITQEELAESLYVSRTAVSKWESGRGYPSIDSLKEIAKFYSVTVDELLSGEKILSLAEKENKNNMEKLCNLFIGLMDILAILLIFMPLYPKDTGGYIYSVSLPAYENIALFKQLTYWIMYVILMLTGVVKSLFSLNNVKKGQGLLTIISLAVSILAVLFLAMSREPYAATLAFVLLVIKAGIIYEANRKNRL